MSRKRRLILRTATELGCMPQEVDLLLWPNSLRALRNVQQFNPGAVDARLLTACPIAAAYPSHQKFLCPHTHLRGSYCVCGSIRAVPVAASQGLDRSACSPVHRRLYLKERLCHPSLKLFVAQCNHRIHPAGVSRGKIGCDQRHAT